MSTVERFLIAMTIIFTLPYLIWRIARIDRFAPLVVVQILGGIILGPGVLGALLPAYFQFVFTAEVIQALNGIAWWAVMMFVWVAGVELDLRQAWKDRRDCSITAGFALGFPLLFGCLLAAVLLTFPGWKGEAALSWQFIAGIGMSCAVTALPILILLLEKLAILRTHLGQRILRYASLDDIAIWAVLAIILMDWQRVGKQLMFLMIFALCTKLFRALIKALSRDDRWYASLIWLAVVSFGADWAGLHFMVGAFLAGAVTDSEWFDQTQMDWLRHHVLLVLMPVFFLSTGLRTSWDTGSAAVFFAALSLLIVAVSGKLIGVYTAARLLKWPKGEAWIIGWLLQTKALIMIIFANILLDKKIITSNTFTALLLMAVASTVLTTPAVRRRIENRLAEIKLTKNGQTHE